MNLSSQLIPAASQDRECQDFKTLNEQATPDEKNNSELLTNQGVNQNSLIADYAFQFPPLRITHMKSSEDLQKDFQENQKILSSMTINIDDLFKKISQLTEEVTSPLPMKQHIISSNTNELITLETTSKSTEALLAKVESLKEKLSKKNCIAEESHLKAVVVDNNLGIKDFEIGGVIGYGKFGEVLQCRHRSTGTLLALKKIFKSTVEEFKMEDQLLTEITVLSQISHPNIIGTFKVLTDDYHYFLLMEYVDGVSLIKKFKSSESEAAAIIRQILLALEYLHERGITHRDLKPENILYTFNKEIKICDFGWASNQPEMDIVCGTLDYVSPEMVHKQSYSNLVDLWEIGVLTYELLFGDAPFKAENKSETFKRVSIIDLQFPSEMNHSEEAQEFIRRLLCKESERMSLKQALCHGFLAKYPTAKEELLFEDISIWGKTQCEETAL